LLSQTVEVRVELCAAIFQIGQFRFGIEADVASVLVEVVATFTVPCFLAVAADGDATTRPNRGKVEGEWENQKRLRRVAILPLGEG
jgi:hypothetical protein